mmetsp:Transcript_169/g.440  ORF Transcript_169/g.440 Transcript_169/m.440 type:complete len:225 (-) Transcript_169:1725-2399(-)
MTTSKLSSRTSCSTNSPKKARSELSACPCSNEDCSKPSTFGIKLRWTCGTASCGVARTVEAPSCSARCATCRSASVTSATSSLSTQAMSASPSSAACDETIASSAQSDACRSGRLDLRRKLHNSVKAVCSTEPPPDGTGAPSDRSSFAAAKAPKALTAVIRVISLRSRSRSTGSTRSRWTAASSPRWQTTSSMQRMAHSFTSWSWSCAKSLRSTHSKSSGTRGL